MTFFGSALLKKWKSGDSTTNQVGDATSSLSLSLFQGGPISHTERKERKRREEREKEGSGISSPDHIADSAPTMTSSK